MSLNVKASWVAVGSESTAGSAVQEANLRVLDAEVTQPSIEVQKPLRPGAATDHGLPAPAVLVGSTATIEISVPVTVAEVVRANAQAAISPPPYDALLQACGLAQTFLTSARTSTYRLGAGKAATILWGAQGRRVKMVGCRGSCQLQVEANSDIMLVFSLQGSVTESHTGSSNARPARAGKAFRRVSPTHADITLTRLNNDGTSASGIALGEALMGLGFDLGAQVSRPGDITSSDGSALPIVTSHEATMTLNLVAGNVAANSQDPLWALINGDGLVSLAAVLHSPDAGATASFKLGSAVLTAGALSDASGIFAQEITLNAADVVANPVEIVFTTPAP